MHCYHTIHVCTVSGFVLVVSPLNDEKYDKLCLDLYIYICVKYVSLVAKLLVMLCNAISSYMCSCLMSFVYKCKIPHFVDL